MKTAFGLILVSLLFFNPGGHPAPQEIGGDAPKTLSDAVAGVRQATVSIELRDGKKAVLDYRTVSAGYEIPMNPGMSDNPEGRAFYEQLMSQRIMQSRLTLDAAVELAGIALQPGRYGVGLSGFKDGRFDLAVFKDRERFKIPLVMDPAPFESPYVAFSFASRSRDTLALIFHAGAKCASVPIKVLAKKKDGAAAGGGVEKEQGL